MEIVGVPGVGVMVERPSLRNFQLLLRLPLGVKGGKGAQSRTRSLFSTTFWNILIDVVRDGASNETNQYWQGNIPSTVVTWLSCIPIRDRGRALQSPS